MRVQLVSFILVIFLVGWTSYLQAGEDRHAVEKQTLQYLLAIDRLDFYTQNLANFLENKKSSEIIQGLRSLKPEDFFNQKFSIQELSNTKEWQRMIFATLLEKKPLLSVKLSDLQWNYEFFKNKLASRFMIKDSKYEGGAVGMISEAVSLSERSVPVPRGGKILLDTEQYISEKTTRAIIWDAILNNRDFGFFVGTQADFQTQIMRNGLQIVAEILPLARNYNKIYLVYHPKTQSYSYAMNLISGDDRIKHLSAQLRLVSFNGRSFFDHRKNKTLVYGSAFEFHQRQERILTELFRQLPRADKIVIGQKGAIDEMIKVAGMLDVISSRSEDTLRVLPADKNQLAKLENLLKKTPGSSLFSGHSVVSGSLIQKAYDITQDVFDRDYKQFNSDQASHDFSDYLLIDNEGHLRRWRIFSAVWGDEIIPIAKALKKTGHSEVVYIGTAGALAQKGLKVGEVVAGDQVYTHSGKVLKFSPGTLVKSDRPFSVGQVHTPFEETDAWIRKNEKLFDLVEVETGYLREHLGPKATLESYFLVSDVVGSENETLAHAAQTSSKRKKGQLRLLENLFVQNGIVAPVSNYEPIPANRSLRSVYAKLKELRPSREELSLLQVAQVAVREGKKSSAELESLLKSQPAFTRKEFNAALWILGSLLAEIQPHLPRDYSVGVVSEALFSGTFNPKVKTSLKVVAEGFYNKTAVMERIGRAKWLHFEEALAKYFTLDVATQGEGASLSAKRFQVSSPESFYRTFENLVIKPAGFALEMDASGSYRLKVMPGIGLQMRCEAVFL